MPPSLKYSTDQILIVYCTCTQTQLPWSSGALLENDKFQIGT